MTRRVIERALIPCVAFAALGPPREAEAQTPPVVVAILPFQDRGSYGQERDIFRALQLGIPATIASELSEHRELRLADPARLRQALSSEEISTLNRLDAATAARIGKDTGARYSVTGSFADFYGKVRLDARIIDTESGQIVTMVSNDPRQENRSELYRIIQNVGHQVLAAVSPSVGSRSIPRLEDRAVPTEALVEFSLGLLAERDGDRPGAIQHYQKALAAYPGYPDAGEALARLRAS
jgi:TolB-like protein